MVDTRYPRPHRGNRSDAAACLLRTEGTGAARAVELLGVTRNGRELVPRPRLHAALQHGRLVAAVAKVSGDLRASLTVVAHYDHRPILVDGLQGLIEILVGRANGPGDAHLGVLVLIAQIERLSPFGRDQLACARRLELLLLQLRSHGLRLPLRRDEKRSRRDAVR